MALLLLDIASSAAAWAAVLHATEEGHEALTYVKLTPRKTVKRTYPN